MYKNVELKDLENVSRDIIKLINSLEKESCVIHLIGDMGAGKTTFVKFLGKELGVEDEIQSPTFTIMREYDLKNISSPKIQKDNEKTIKIKKENKKERDSFLKSEINKREKLLHIDAYRFENKDEGNILALHKKIEDKNIIVIEWSEKMNAPKYDIEIKIEKTKEENVRNIYIRTRD